MTDTNTAIIILDRSGSMASTWDDTVGGLADYIGKLDAATRVRLVDFDNEVTLHDEVAAGAWTLPEGIHPRGCTALLDAVGKTLSAALAERGQGSRVAVLILTDGAENASREYKRDAVAKLVQRCQDRGWLVTFLGANVEAFAEGQSLGVRAGTTAQFRQGNEGAAFEIACSLSGGYFASGDAEPELSDEDRRKLAE